MPRGANRSPGLACRKTSHPVILSPSRYASWAGQGMAAFSAQRASYTPQGVARGLPMGSSASKGSASDTGPILSRSPSARAIRPPRRGAHRPEGWANRSVSRVTSASVKSSVTPRRSSRAALFWSTGGSAARALRLPRASSKARCARLSKNSSSALSLSAQAAIWAAAWGFMAVRAPMPSCRSRFRLASNRALVLSSR